MRTLFDLVLYLKGQLISNSSGPNARRYLRLATAERESVGRHLVDLLGRWSRSIEVVVAGAFVDLQKFDFPRFSKSCGRYSLISL